MRAALLVTLCEVFACKRSEPAQTHAVPVAAPAVIADGAVATLETGPLGWWRSDDLCFELFANGDFQLSLMTTSLGPKVQVLGSATVVTQKGNDVTFSLAVKRIWKARFTGHCRRIHHLGDWTDEVDGLGTTFKKDSTVTVRLQRSDDDHANLCAATCAALHRETPTLAGRWRRTGWETPFKPTGDWKAGDLVELRLDKRSSHLWFAAAAPAKNGGMVDDIGGDATARNVAPDRFTITFTPPSGSASELTAERVPGEQLRVCVARDRCTTLDRQFDAYSHDLD